MTTTATDPVPAAGGDQTHVSVRQAQQYVSGQLSDGASGVQSRMQRTHVTLEEWEMFMARVKAAAAAVSEDSGTFGAGVRQQAVQQAEQASVAQAALHAAREALALAAQAVHAVTETAGALTVAVSKAVGD